MDAEKEIKSWGLPEYFKAMELRYKFESGSHFFLIDKKNEKRFEMDFDTCPRAFRRANGEEDIMLKFVYVPLPEDRRNGVCSFFLKKLLEYCKVLDIHSISLAVGSTPQAIPGFYEGNQMVQADLKKFYEKYLGCDSDIDLRIIL